MAKTTITYNTRGYSAEAALLLADPRGDIYAKRYPQWGGPDGILEVTVPRRRDGSLGFADVIAKLDEMFERI